MAGGIEVRLLGRFVVLHDGVPVPDERIGSRKGRTLLKLLAVDRGRLVSLDRIVDAVWGDEPPARPEENVAVLVSRLRKTFGPELIGGGRAGYRLVAAADLRVDVDEADRLTAEAEARLSAAEPALARVAAEEALSILEAGSLLEDEPAAAWCEVARTEAEHLRRRARRATWRAAADLGEPAIAEASARRAVSEDVFDEEATRALMRALHARGETAAALAAFERLRNALAEDLGADPSPETRAVHLAILRDEPLETSLATAPQQLAPATAGGSGPQRPEPPAVSDPGFVGRADELARVRDLWSSAATGAPCLVVIAGEAGIGKTRLATEAAALAESVGGAVVRTRCYEAERSLFLQPFVEAVRAVAVAMDPALLRDLAGEHAGTLADLVPEVGRVLRPHRYAPAPPEMERRRAFETMATFVQGLARRRPSMLLIDDLHNAGASSVELLHFLARRLTTEPLAIVATIRAEEGQETLDQIRDVAHVVELGPLGAEAVDDLARAMGAPGLGRRVRALTRGHTLFAVEAIRALREGAREDAVPETLREAVLARLRRADATVEPLLRAACILGSAFELPATAALMDAPLDEVAASAEAALRSRLLVESGSGYEFANDLIQEVVYRTTPMPTRVLRHRRAADLLAGNPEAVATHAAAASEWALALGAWRQAAALAAGRYANRDAELLLDRALAAAQTLGDRAGEAEVRLDRGRVRRALRRFEASREDLDLALVLARSTGLRRLEMQCLREQGGDITIALGLPARDCIPYLEAALEMARELDDPGTEATILGRLSVVHANCGRFDLATQAADLGIAQARSTGDEGALTGALDGRKMAAAHLGEFAVLDRCVRELEGLLRRSGDIFLLQWAVFESSFEPMARARWEEAVARIDEALALNRHIDDRSMEAWFVSHLSWIERARGDLDRALALGSEAVAIADEVGHSWCLPFALTMLGWTLQEAQEIERSQHVLRRALSLAERNGAEFYLARSLAHLAWSTWLAGDRAVALELTGRAESSLEAVRTPPGTAFLHGAHAYAAAARVLLEAGEPERAERVLAPILPAAAAADWKEAHATAALLTGRALVARGKGGEGVRLLEDALHVAGDAGLAGIAAEAATELRAAPATST